MCGVMLASAEAAHHVGGHEVPGGVTAVFAVLLVAMITALALEEKIHAKKSVIVGVFAGACLVLATALDLLHFGDVILPDGHTFPMPIYITSIEWEVITIILGASLFVEVTSRSGVFTWMAISLTKKSGGDPWKLLLAYGVLTVVFSAMLNNVTAMIIIGSLTGVSLAKLQRTDLLLGFLVVEGLLTNVGGLLTLISSVPNIIVGGIAGIGFVDFFLVAAPYVVIATAVTLWMGRWKFAIGGLRDEAEREAAAGLVDGFDENESVTSAKFFWFSIAALMLFVFFLAGQSKIPVLSDLGMGFVALSFAGIVLLAYKHEVDKFYSVVDWDLLAFFAGLFVVINTMEHAQVLAVIGTGIETLIDAGASLGTALLLVSSAVASSVTDNIPLAAMLAKILKNHDPAYAANAPYWWSVIFGATLGGNITPIGSASTVVAMTIIHKNKLPLSFIGFVKVAVPFALVQIVVAVVYVVGLTWAGVLSG
ncbi:MAG: SLC13 family permease [Planctomycetota bacterium]|nr:SLC13 family permease [Planctomycetota bacterium]